MKAQTLLSLTSSVLLGLPIFKCEAAKKEKPINVIYILADDLGYGDIGCYGQEKIKTPNIDRMAKNGMLFTQNYAGCTVSAPSRASLMTGLHTGHTQIRGNEEIDPEGQQPMTADTYTIGKLMHAAGYTTGIFGKWGLGYPGSTSDPNSMGFDEFFGYNCQRQAHSFYPDHLWHNKERVDLKENENNGRRIYSQDLIHEHGIQFIKDNKDKPFFAMLTYTLPHAELNLPHDSIYKMYENQFEEKPYNSKYGYYPSEKPKASFAAMVSKLDFYIGQVLEELKRQGLDKNTLVIFSSDNGPHREGGADPDFFKSYGPLKGVKRDVYEGGIRTPMIAWLPGKVQAGTKTNQITAFWDILPTLSELTKTKLPVKTDGISILPTLFSGKGQKQHKYLYWEFHEEGGCQAIRKGNWKAIRQHIVGGKPTFELYDLSKDIHEDNDVSAQFPQVAKEMKNLMDKARTESPIFKFGK